MLNNSSFDIKFKKNAKKYFEDCEKQFKIKDLEEIITFYKTQCN